MMNLAKLICALCLLLACEKASAQEEEHWETYMAAYEKGPAITLVNMGIKDKAPVTGQGFLLITGVTFTLCENGLPTAEMLETLQPIDDAVARQVSFLGTTTFAGTRTQNCERLNYFYISDSMDVRFSLLTFYKDNFKEFKNTIIIRNDPEWKDYLEVLYPNEIIREQIDATKVLSKLSEAGDKLQKERLIDYNVYFPDEKSRSAFIELMKKEGFQITEQQKRADLEGKPWFVMISKTAIPHPQTIGGIALYLRKKAAELGGHYSGWETILIKN